MDGSESAGSGSSTWRWMGGPFGYSYTGLTASSPKVANICGVGSSDRSVKVSSIRAPTFLNSDDSRSRRRPRISDPNLCGNRLQREPNPKCGPEKLSRLRCMPLHYGHRKESDHDRSNRSHRKPDPHPPNPPLPILRNLPLLS